MAAAVGIGALGIWLGWSAAARIRFGIGVAAFIVHALACGMLLGPLLKLTRGNVEQLLWCLALWLLCLGACAIVYGLHWRGEDDASVVRRRLSSSEQALQRLRESQLAVLAEHSVQLLQHDADTQAPIGFLAASVPRLQLDPRGDINERA